MVLSLSTFAVMGIIQRTFLMSGGSYPQRTTTFIPFDVSKLYPTIHLVIMPVIGNSIDGCLSALVSYGWIILYQQQATSNSVHVYVVWHIAYSMRNDFGCQAMFHLFVKRLPAFIFLWTPLQQQGRVLLIWVTPATFDLHLALTIKHRSILCKVVANTHICIAFSASCKYAGFGYTSVCCR